MYIILCIFPKTEHIYTFLHLLSLFASSHLSRLPLCGSRRGRPLTHFTHARTHASPPHHTHHSMSEAKNEQPELPQVVRDAQARTAPYRAHHTGQGPSAKVQPAAAARRQARDRHMSARRDRYDNGEEVVLIATDRLSAFDRQLAEIPFKERAQLDDTLVARRPSTWWTTTCSTAAHAPAPRCTRTSSSEESAHPSPSSSSCALT